MLSPLVIPRSITSLPSAQALRCVCGVMAHPGDPSRQQEFISWSLADAIALPPEIVRSLATAAERGVGNDFDDARLPGSMAAGVLVHVLQAKASGLDDFGVDKASFLVSETLRTEKRTGAGRDTVRANWKRFRSVAHLWAAYLRVEEVAREQPEGHRIVWHEHAQEFFRFAQSLLFAAERCQLHGGAPLLDSNQCWHFEGIEPAEFHVAPLTEGEHHELAPVLARFVPRDR